MYHFVLRTLLFVGLAVSSMRSASGQVSPTRCDAKSAQTGHIAEEKAASRANFLRSIDSDAWQELRKDAAPDACLFGLFSMSDEYAAFSHKRDAYLSTGSSDIAALERPHAEHAGFPDPVEGPLSRISPAADGKARSGIAKFWTVGLSAPEQMINGTQSQQSFGGNFGLTLASDDVFINKLDFTAEGVHTRTWKVMSPSIEVHVTLPTASVRLTRSPLDVPHVVSVSQAYV